MNGTDGVGAESKPPAMAGQVLEREQLRYCLAEKIRLLAIKTKYDLNAKVAMDMFNARVDDFNARCSKVHYRKADMTIVSRVIDQTIANLQQDADLWR